MNHRTETRTLVIGSGIAGCTAALRLADHGFHVTLVNSGGTPDSGNSSLAQGGIVYRAPDDRPEALIRDILVAGHNHNNLRAVRFLAEHGPRAVEEILIDRVNIPFARGHNPQGEWDMALEGGHSAQRILHCADHTGKTIMEGLIRAVLKHPNVTFLPHRTAIDILTTHHHACDMELRYQIPNQCVGAYIFNEELQHVETLLAEFTILATGGIGQIYQHTTNPATAVGSGIAMAQRAGVHIENAEFVQFHPTALYEHKPRRFLITEALRGAGAKLINSKNEPFMARYDARADLAPRDIVARAIMEEMLHSGQEFVYLDAANYAHEDLTERFPTIYKHCLEMGVDITKEPIPVVPAAHYFCGGILTDTRGRTTMERLYAIGECACTGLHGANRLASTSLLEALVWGKSAADDIAGRLRKKSGRARKLFDGIPDWVSLGNEKNDDPALIAQDWATIRRTMWNYVGITRTQPRLRRAVDELKDLSRHLTEFYRRTKVCKALIDLFQGCQTAITITEAAKRNKKSLGCHYRVG